MLPASSSPGPVDDWTAGSWPREEVGSSGRGRLWRDHLQEGSPLPLAGGGGLPTIPGPPHRLGHALGSCLAGGRGFRDRPFHARPLVPARSLLPVADVTGIGRRAPQLQESPATLAKPPAPPALLTSLRKREAQFPFLALESGAELLGSPGEARPGQVGHGEHFLTYQLAERSWMHCVIHLFQVRGLQACLQYVQLSPRSVLEYFYEPRMTPCPHLLSLPSPPSQVGAGFSLRGLGHLTPGSPRLAGTTVSMPNYGWGN